MGEDTLSEGTVRNAVNGIDPMRPGRIKVICKVLAKYGDGVPYEHLTILDSGEREKPTTDFATGAPSAQAGSVVTPSASP
jgi:hypothetical protein